MSKMDSFNEILKTPLCPQNPDIPIEINQTDYDTDNPRVKSIYKSKKNIFDCIAFYIVLIIGIFIFLLLTYIYISKKVKNVFIGFVFIFVWMTGFIYFTNSTPFYVVSIINPFKGTITNKIKKLCCCLSKTKIYHINEVKKIIIDKDESINYNINGVHYDAFKVDFLLQNNQIETIFSRIIDKDNESQNAFNIFKNAISNVQYLNQNNENNIEIQNIQSLNDIPHKLIKQINSNEFYIKNETNKGDLCLVILVGGAFLSFFIYVLIKSGLKECINLGFIFGFIFSAFFFCLGIYGLIYDIKSLTFYLEQDKIRIKFIYNCCCIKDNIILKHGDFQRFGIKLLENSKSQSIFYINNEGKKKNLITLNFYGDEASYLVNVLNKYINSNRNYI